MSTRSIYPLAACLIGGLALVFSAVSAAAAGKRPNPASKLFVAETKGDSHIDTGEKIEPLTQRSVYTADGTMIETKANGSDALVFSNGTAISVGPNTRFEVKKFLQEPFTPNRTDLDVEPSISQTMVKLVHGSIGVCTSRLVAGSSMIYTTPHGTVNIRGHKVLLEVSEKETRVVLLEGDVTVIAEEMGASQTLTGGQQAILRRDSPDAPVVVEVQSITAENNTRADENVALACISRRTVYFEAVDRPGEAANPAEVAQDLRPVEVVPARLPVQFTVSPSRLP